jgi:hypothetical protein
MELVDTTDEMYDAMYFIDTNKNGYYTTPQFVYLLEQELSHYKNTCGQFASVSKNYYVAIEKQFIGNPKMFNLGRLKLCIDFTQSANGTIYSFSFSNWSSPISSTDLNKYYWFVYKDALADYSLNLY